jgi:hypothetical protein
MQNSPAWVILRHSGQIYWASIRDSGGEGKAKVLGAGAGRRGLKGDAVRLCVTQQRWLRHVSDLSDCAPQALSA